MTAVSQAGPVTAAAAVVDLEAVVPCAMDQCPDVGVAVWACAIRHMDGGAILTDAITGLGGERP